jgi:glycosyltransferase involved in cell wall biosynthesis
MACLVLPPQGGARGVAIFTTQERDKLIRRHDDIRTGVAALKSRYLVGLHHNWHDTSFRHDPLFDFNLAGEGDLISAEPFPLLPMDACNFAPPVFAPGGEKFWDVLFVARAVKFKGIPEFFRAIRALYDRGQRLRVLMLCPTPPPATGTESGLRVLFERMFEPGERRLFSFITMEWDYPFPLDAPTLAHFYRASRIFVHSAPDERRCRVAGYAWAAGMPVVGMACISSVLPVPLRRPPFFFECQDYAAFPDAIIAALDSAAGRPDFGPAIVHVSQLPAAGEMVAILAALACEKGRCLSAIPINAQGFDLRLGRHHGLATGFNRLEQDLAAFIAVLKDSSDAELAAFAAADDPECAIVARSPVPPRAVDEPRPPSRVLQAARKIKKALT